MDEKTQILAKLRKILSLSGNKKPKAPSVPPEISKLDKIYDFYYGFYGALLDQYVAELVDIAAAKTWPNGSRFHSWDRDDFYQAIFVPPGIDRDKIYAGCRKEFDAVKKKAKARIAAGYDGFVEMIAELNDVVSTINSDPELKAAATQKFYFNIDRAERNLKKLAKMPKAKFTTTLLNWGEWVDDPKQATYVEVFDPFFEEHQELYYGFYDFS